MPGPEELKNPSRQLPRLALGPAGGGSDVPIRPGTRRIPVLVLVHGGECSECAAYLHALAGSAGELREWNAHILAISSPEDGSPYAIVPVALPFAHLVDPVGCLADTLQIDAPALIIADSWGEIALERQAGAEHDFPTVAEVLGWARFLDTSCPECQGEAY